MGRLDQKIAIKKLADVFLISTPGEYEIKDVFVYSVIPKNDYPVIIHHLNVEDITIVHLSEINHPLSDEIIEELGEVDILMIPVGGKDVLDVKGAIKIISQLNPKIVIPMYYKIRGLNTNLENIDHFCKEMGVKKNGIEKLSIKKNINFFALNFKTSLPVPLDMHRLIYFSLFLLIY